jgi:Trk-type K+ transport system membrane component
MVVGVLFLLIIFLKGKLYRKVKDSVNKKFPSLAKLPPWVQKLVIILIFILIYLLAKELIFFVLKLGGIDVREIMVNSVNQSLA